MNEFGTELPAFPKKSLLPLSTKEKEERRFQLEKFLQKSSFKIEPINFLYLIKN